MIISLPRESTFSNTLVLTVLLMGLKASGGIPERPGEMSKSLALPSNLFTNGSPLQFIFHPTQSPALCWEAEFTCPPQYPLTPQYHFSLPSKPGLSFACPGFISASYLSFGQRNVFWSPNSVLTQVSTHRDPCIPSASYFLSTLHPDQVSVQNNLNLVCGACYTTLIQLTDLPVVSMIKSLRIKE